MSLIEPRSHLPLGKGSSQGGGGMGLDNTIIVLETRDGFRVANVADKYKLYYSGSDEEEIDISDPIYLSSSIPGSINIKMLREVFQDSPVFSSEEDALEYAAELEEEVGYVEYGAEILRFPDMYFDNSAEICNTCEEELCDIGMSIEDVAEWDSTTDIY